MSQQVESFDEFFALLSDELVKRLKGKVLAFVAEPISSTTANLVIAARVDPKLMSISFFEFKVVFLGESPRNLRMLIKDILVPAITNATVRTVVVANIYEASTTLRVTQMARDMLLLRKPSDQNFRLALKGWLEGVSAIGTEEIISAAKEALELI